MWDHPLDEAVTREVCRAKRGCRRHRPQARKVPGFTHNEWRLVVTCPVGARREDSGAHEVSAHRRSRRPVSRALEARRARPRDSRPGARFAARTRATLSAVHCFVPLEHLGSDLTIPVGNAFAADARREEVEKLLRLGRPGHGRCPRRNWAHT